MQEMIIKLGFKICEGFQSASLNINEKSTNIFHRNVSSIESTDLAFISGIISSGLRGSAILNGQKLINNYTHFTNASQKHLPLVVNSNVRLSNKNSRIVNYEPLFAIQKSGCFQLIAHSAQEEIYWTLIAHRIAELSLIPGIVISDFEDIGDVVSIPDDDLIIRYLGNPDDQIICPTPSQELIFGKTRRRIPNWFSFDYPVMVGVQKDSAAISNEKAANHQYFYQHLENLIKKACDEFAQIIGPKLEPITLQGKASNYALVSLGGHIKSLHSELESIQQKAQLITINQLYPLPKIELIQSLKGKKMLTVFETMTGVNLDSSLIYESVLKCFEGSKSNVYEALYGNDLDSETLHLAIEHMIQNKALKKYYLGIGFANSESNFPYKQILNHEIEKNYPSLKNKTLQIEKNPIHSIIENHEELPLEIRLSKDKGPNYSQLSKFYNNTAFFYEHNNLQEVEADPFATLSIVPRITASVFNQSTKRNLIPIFNPSNCTGCGDCFIYCPHSALPPIAIGIEQLLKVGINLASAKGEPILKLIPLLQNFAKVSEQIIKEIDILEPEDFLPIAFSRLSEQMNLEGEKLELIQAEFSRVLKEISTFPVSKTSHFFDLPSSIESGKGELFSVFVNPSSCTGCSICAEVCSEEAIVMQAQNSENLEKVKNQYKLWEQTPDTSGETINRLYQSGSYSPLAAILLSRNYYMSMVGATNNELINPYKSLMHIITSSTEAVVQPKIVRKIKKLDELINDLSTNIHKKLSDSLPDKDLDVLSKSLKNSHNRKIQIKDLLSNITADSHSNLIDTEELSRKSDLVEDLKKLKYLLAEGPNGSGRSRYGLFIDASNALDWINQFPINNFTSPNIIYWDGSAPEQLQGLFYGQLRFVLDHIKLMRRASLEVKDKYDPLKHDDAIASLAWHDLSDDEKQLIPPILLISENKNINALKWQGLYEILAQSYPVKIFLLDDAIPIEKSFDTSFIQKNSNLIGALALKNAFVFQSGMGNIQHLFKGLMDGLIKNSPALFSLHSTNLDFIKTSNKDSRIYDLLAIESRAFPVLCYNPGPNNNFLFGSTSIDENRDVRLNWIEERLSISNENSIPYEITWADWAFTLKNWEHEFVNIDSDNAAIVSISDYIRIEKSSRKDKIPTILRINENESKYYAVSERVVKMCESVLSNWNNLQELSGVISEYPEKLKSEINKELTLKFEIEVEEMKKNYEKKLKDQVAFQTEMMKNNLKNKLVSLSKMAKNNT